MTTSLKEAMLSAAGILPMNNEKEAHGQTPRDSLKKAYRKKPEDADVEKFYNPYHFVPVDPDDKKDKWRPKGLFFESDADDIQHWSHKLYAYIDYGKKPIYHGRIVCRLTTKTPIFIGDKCKRVASDDAPALIAPFELNCQPAIPATSLRGVISSVAEAASNSSLRVLENKLLSRRMDPKEALSALGIIQVLDNGREGVDYQLYPIAAPVMSTEWQPISLSENKKPNYKKLDGRLAFSLPDRFKKFFGENKIYPKICFGDNGTETDTNNEALKTFSSHNKQKYYLICNDNGELAKTGLISEEQLTPENRRLKTRPESKEVTGSLIGRHLLLYQKCTNYRLVRKEKASEEDREKGIIGIIRYFPFPFDPNKKHHYFFPFSEEIQEIKNRDWKEIPSSVVKTFEQLSDQRTEEEKNKLLPNVPHKTIRNTSRDLSDKYVRLKTGDIVFFNVDENGIINYISFSGIWRNVSGGSTFDYFSSKVKDDEGNDAKELDREILPYHSDREKISPVEMVFGFVENQTNDSPGAQLDGRKKAHAYAGRVRFSHGIYQGTPAGGKTYDDNVTLKILDSPKPPSPALYFTMREHDPQFIEKKSLNVNDYKPQGRKFYLHHRASDIHDKCWKSHFDQEHCQKNPGDKLKNCRFKQKVEITPIPSEREFWFHIDFDNLNEYELGMLLYSLLPNKNFQHKIGMGKPLGLGSVAIEPIALHLINRYQRYKSLDLFAEDRYTESLIVNKDAWDKRPDQYKLMNSPNSKTVSNFPMRDEFEKTIDQKIKTTLMTLGDPENVKHPVHTPLQKGQTGEKAELKTFKWFVKNDKEKKQFLKPIDSSKVLPWLYKN